LGDTGKSGDGCSHRRNQVGHESKTHVLALTRTINKQNYSRDDEKDKTILEDERDETRAASRWESEPPAGEKEDKEVECHGVYERSRENGVVGCRNDASLSLDPSCLDQHSWITGEVG
jgi:hypothetical protein